MAADIGKTFPLLRLPNELITLVSEHADAETTSSLRLVCRKVRDCAEEAFLSKHFSERCFMLASSYSLNYLVEISKDVRYAKHVRCLWFDALTYRSRSGNPVTRIEWPERIRAALCDIFHGLKQASNLNVEVKWVLSHEQHAVEWDRNGLSGAREAWSHKIRPYNATTAFLRPYYPVGLAKLRDCDFSTPSYLLQDAVLLAIQSAQLPLRAADLGHLRDPIEPWYFANCTALRLECLQTLRLRVSLERLGLDADGHEPGLSNFVRTLWSAVNLRSVFYSTVSEYYEGYPAAPGDLLHRLITGTPHDGTRLEVDRTTGLWPRLQTFEVADTIGPHLQRLLDFLTLRSSTLKDVKIRSWHEDQETMLGYGKLHRSAQTALGGDDKQQDFKLMVEEALWDETLWYGDGDDDDDDNGATVVTWLSLPSDDSEVSDNDLSEAEEDNEAGLMSGEDDEAMP